MDFPLFGWPQERLAASTLVKDATEVTVFRHRWVIGGQPGSRLELWRGTGTETQRCA
jgi:hypothetical protein